MIYKKLIVVAFLIFFSTLRLFGQSKELDRYVNSQNGDQKSNRLNKIGGDALNFTQKIMHELSGGYNQYLLPYNISDFSNLRFLQSINYIPRYPVWKGGDLTSLTIGSDIGVALQFSNMGNIFVLNLPLNLEFNVGRGSSLLNDDLAGVFVGLGAGYNFANKMIPIFVEDSSGFWLSEFENLSQFGLHWSAGIRVLLFKRPYSIRLSQSLFEPTQQVNISTISFGISFY